MLTELGLPVLRWVDDVAIKAAYDVLDEALHQLHRFDVYVSCWRHTLEGDVKIWFTEVTS